MVNWIVQDSAREEIYEPKIGDSYTPLTDMRIVSLPLFALPQRAGTSTIHDLHISNIRTQEQD